MEGERTEECSPMKGAFLEAVKFSDLDEGLDYLQRTRKALDIVRG